MLDHPLAFTGKLAIFRSGYHIPNNPVKTAILQPNSPAHIG
jgi:hypothetical protein